jgi:predicted Zn-dependent protease
MAKTIMLAVFLLGMPAADQFGQIQRAITKAEDFTFTDAEERQLGAEISARLREKYGVVQDPAVHKYLTLVGSVLASSSNRPALQWTFIVLDTDGVNAFAAPVGFVHITRGALALIQNEAELADVVGHEIGHVAQKHTINAIKKSKVGADAAGAARSALLEQAINMGYEFTLENKYDRNDENDADRVGLALADKAGYSSAGLSAFLTRLAERNKGLKDRSGMFASHPEMKGRLDDLSRYITAQKLTASAIVAARYAESVQFTPVPVDQLEQVAPPAAPAVKPAEIRPGGSGRFGLGGLNPLGREKSSSQTVASAGSRGVNPDRDAKGGPNKSAVVVTVTAAEIAEFRTGITG